MGFNLGRCSVPLPHLCYCCHLSSPLLQCPRAQGFLKGKFPVSSQSTKGPRTFKLGKGELDIKDAYRLVPVHLANRHLLGIQPPTLMGPFHLAFDRLPRFLMRLQTCCNGIID